MYETEERNEFFEKTVSRLPFKQFDYFQFSWYLAAYQFFIINHIETNILFVKFKHGVNFFICKSDKSLNRMNNLFFFYPTKL